MDGVSFTQLYVVPTTAPLKLIAVVLVPLQTVWLPTTVTVGVGCTVIVKFCEGPVQVTDPKVYSGVTVIVAIVVVAPAFTATNDAILPVPDAARPIDGVSFTQLKTVAVPEKFTDDVLAVLQTTWLAGATTLGVGFTVIVKFVDTPVHPLNTGVTVIVATTGTVPPFTPANAAMLPLPLAANPIEGVLLVQLKVVPPTAPLNVIAVVLLPLQTTWLATAATVGVGLTVIVKLVGVPGHPLNTGVTVIVATVGTAPVFTPVKTAILPDPLAPKPIEGSLLVQLNVVPTTAPLNVIAAVLFPLHTTWLPTAATVGVGCTVIVKFCGVPGHPEATGVTVIVATTVETPAFTAGNDAMLPDPLAASPIEGVSLVQLYVVPPTAPVKFTAATFDPLHITWLATAATVGVGLTVIVKLVEVPGHPLDTGVTVIVDTTGAVPVFTPVKAAMLPEPLAANPIEVSLLVQLYVVPTTAPLKVIAVVLTPLQTT